MILRFYTNKLHPVSVTPVLRTTLLFKYSISILFCVDSDTKSMTMEFIAQFLMKIRQIL